MLLLFLNKHKLTYLTAGLYFFLVGVEFGEYTDRLFDCFVPSLAFLLVNGHEKVMVALYFELILAHLKVADTKFLHLPSLPVNSKLLVISCLFEATKQR